MPSDDPTAVTLTPPQLDTLVSLARDGISLDGLTVRQTTAGFAFRTPDTTRTVSTRTDLRSAAKLHPRYVTNWEYWQTISDDHPDATYEFLRWLEHAQRTPVPERYDSLGRPTGVARTWGELRITTTLTGDGHRRYSIRHERDAPEDPTGLAPYDSPRDARSIATYDEYDRYRPLKSARSLPTGWWFPTLDATTAVDVIGVFYPVSITNWWLDQTNTLDTEHWIETARTQTGRYEQLETLSLDALGWATAACCVDSQCVKRRTWEYDENQRIASDPGAGPIPCRRPCALFLEGAYHWNILDQDPAESRDHTPRDHHLETSPPTVTPTRTPSIKEAEFDRPGNRYRARYRRAKRSDAPTAGPDPPADPEKSS